MTQTKVVFRKWRKSEGGGILALFPQDAGSVGKPWTCSSYEHVGQHGAADVGIVQRTLPAKPAEYRELAKELRRIGYKLNIATRCTRADYEMRKEQLK